MNWQLIQDTLREWFYRLSGLPTYWHGEAVENVEHPFAELRVDSSQGLGVDETRETVDPAAQDGSEITRQQWGNRLFTLTCRVETRDQTPAGAARNYLEKVRIGLMKPSSLAYLRTACLALVASEPVLDQDRFFQDRQESVADMDVRFATVATETDPKEAGGYFDRIEATSNLKNVDGSPLPASLQLNREEMP